MDYALEFKPMALVSEEEKEVLRELTIQPEIGRSLFRQWLDHPNPVGIFVSTVYNGNILGWASVNTRIGWNMGTVGAFIREDQRGNGIAHAALENLLANLVLTECSPKPEYLYYQEGMDNLFAQIIERNGFKPLCKYKREYRERELKAKGIILEEVSETVRYYC